MDYFNARYFTNALGGFNSPDPGNAGADPTDPQTWNAYENLRKPGQYTQIPGETSHRTGTLLSYAAYRASRYRRRDASHHTKCVLGETHLWRAMAYIERNPVRAGLCRRAADYPWSSACAHSREDSLGGLLHLDTWRRRYDGRIWRERKHFCSDCGKPRCEGALAAMPGRCGSSNSDWGETFIRSRPHDRASKGKRQNRSGRHSATPGNGSYCAGFGK